jgi:hypothetical protein
MGEMMIMTTKTILAATAAGLLVLGAGCRKNAVDTGAFKTAINNYYSSRQVCLWSSPVKFPVQADTNNEEQTKAWDALTDSGMLQRSSAEKKRFLVGSKQVNDYDLSQKGRSAWAADASQPGYGNFCFGSPEVSTIDSYNPPNDNGATQYTVSYHYGVSHIPDWANSAEMQTAFPKLGALSSNQKTANATLTKSDNGWQVAGVTPPAGAPPLPQ